MSRQKAVLDAISKIMHPAINCSLAELNIVRYMNEYEKNVFWNWKPKTGKTMRMLQPVVNLNFREKGLK